jgi:hypothetical protein
MTESRYGKIPFPLENELRCGCQHHSDVVAKYNHDTVEIRCKHGKFVRLKVVVTNEYGDPLSNADMKKFRAELKEDKAE